MAARPVRHTKWTGTRLVDATDARFNLTGSDPIGAARKIARLEGGMTWTE